MMNMTNAILSSVSRSARRRQRHGALAALLGAGLLLGVTTNLAKVAHGLGIAPLAYLTWSLVGAALLLTAVSRYRGHTAKVNRRSLEYYVIAGFLTTAGSNLIFFNAVPHLGVSFIALMFSLPPLLTYVGALIMRMERFCWWRASGVVLALAGTATLVIRQLNVPNVDPTWIVIALVGPVLLSIGNIYRSRRWPPEASAESLAPGMLMGAIGILMLFAMVFGWSLSIPGERAYAIPLIALQAAVFAGQFLLLFVLQKAGGPVFLSLMGGVSAVFGIPIAMVLLAEPVLPSFLPSAMLIAAGIITMLLGVKACERQLAQSRIA
jgi:drug/metabolite transporter (DMT)-like permease